MKIKQVKETVKDIELMCIPVILQAREGDQNLARLMYKIAYLASLTDAERGGDSPLASLLQSKYGAFV